MTMLSGTIQLPQLPMWGPRLWTVCTALGRASCVMGVEQNDVTNSISAAAGK